MKYLPDTNIFIRALNGRDPEAEFLQEHISEVVVSVIVIAEFWVKPQSGEIEKFEELTNRLDIIPIDREVAKQAGIFRGQLLSKSSRVYLQDCFLAAQAKVHHLTLVTNNKADFPMQDIKIVTPKK